MNYLKGFLKKQPKDQQNDKDINAEEKDVETQVNYKEQEFIELTLEQINNLIQNFEFKSLGEIRDSIVSHSKGGMQCLDNRISKNIKILIKETIKKMGKQIFQGQIQLTKFSMPIGICSPTSYMERSIQGTNLFYYFINKASKIEDPLERFKLFITNQIANLYISNSFAKPLNPIIGETLKGNYNDGSQIYVEQISHHPPIPYFYMIGPNNEYKYYGYFDMLIKPYYTQLKLQNLGKRTIVFKNGDEITFQSAPDYYSVGIWGNLRLQTLDSFIFEDKKNELFCEIQLNSVSGKPSDYFQSYINQKGQQVSKVYGTYLGFVDIDNKRYWNYNQEVQPLKANYDNPLQSNFENRIDLQFLKEGKIEQAQKGKEELEQIQRYDNKLRKEYIK